MLTDDPTATVSRQGRSRRILLLRILLQVLATGVVAAFACVAVAGEPRAPRDAIVADFTKPLAEPWRWIREHRGAWRVSPAGLQVLVEPGNMWGGANDARNVLVREIPAAWCESVEIVAELSHRPRKRWEQADLAWYYDDSTMVKLGLEIEYGRTNVVMGREEGDKTETIAIVPYPHEQVRLRLRVVDNEIVGSFRGAHGGEWTEAGRCKLPAAPEGKGAHASLQFYQGEAGSDRWANVSALLIKKLPAPNR